MEKIAAVVVTYNRKALLRDCVRHLLAQKGMSCDILLVDNASTDGTGAWAQEIGKTEPRLRYRNTGANLGGAGGFCFGVRWAVEAGYAYVWLMDDDTLPQPEALARLWAAHVQLKGAYGWLSSRCLWTDGTLCPMNVQRVTPYRDLTGTDRTLAPVQMASFASLFLRAEVVERYGLPLRQFFIWTDDWEYTRRISRQLPCYAVQDSCVVHAMKSRTVANIATDVPERLGRYRYFYRNDVYLYRREGAKGWLWLLAKDLWHSVQVLRRGGRRWEKWKIIWGGLGRGVGFRPQIEFCRRPAVRHDPAGGAQKDERPWRG